MYRETHVRSIAKALSWRILGTVATTTLFFVFTGKIALSLAVGGLEFISKIALFWLHERIWDRIRAGKLAATPAVIWLTGFSGSGKSTLATWVSDALRKRGLKVEQLDGDSIRQIFPKTGFSRAEREEHIKRVGFLAGKLEDQGVFVVVSLVSPYADSRAFVRGLCKSFIEVHVSTPLAECERRDTKGLYAKARRGEIKNFTGIDDPYEAPQHAEVVVDTSQLPLEAAGEKILAQLKGHY